MTNHTRIQSEEKTSPSPSNAINTPEIIGLRVRAYNPSMTNFSGGAHGASVPSPIFENILIVTIRRDRPVRIVNIPRIKKRVSITGLIFQLIVVSLVRYNIREGKMMRTVIGNM